MIIWLTLLLVLPQAPDTTNATPKIVATVGETTITKRAVDFLIAQRVKGIFAEEADSVATFDVARKHLIDQAVVLDYLESRPKVAVFDVSFELANLEKQLVRSGQTLNTWLSQQRRHRQDLEFEIRWRQRWSTYTESLLGDLQQRAKAFESWGYHFDGSQVEVAQILLKVDSQNRQTQLKLAGEIHARLIEKVVVFETAADIDEQWKVEVLAHSQSPNRNDQERPGYVGQIEYRYPMPERFAKESFSLAPGEISPAFETGLGIHIVRVLNRQPGTRTIDQCKDALDSTMKREAFQAILDRHRENVSVTAP